jgi:hypothetical protein
MIINLWVQSQKAFKWPIFKVFQPKVAGNLIKIFLRFLKSEGTKNVCFYLSSQQSTLLQTQIKIRIN